LYAAYNRKSQPTSRFTNGLIELSYKIAIEAPKLKKEGKNSKQGTFQLFEKSMN
jgi:hypothetical protein